ncbi:hypothetical protein B5E84_19145 [Lachnoclostridium sp. An14]|nr:hypothetical protein B5E84_19145 [Lachnoclostridium sp. An14]
MTANAAVSNHESQMVSAICRRYLKYEAFRVFSGGGRFRAEEKGCWCGRIPAWVCAPARVFYIIRVNKKRGEGAWYQR